MKKILIALIIAVTTLCAYAQKDVTQFLDIPVDGSKYEIIQKLKAKGFRTNSYNKDVLEGVFNGRNVNIYIVTNGYEVYRIMVCDAQPVDERSIQIRFNNLCHQFENNPKYINLGYELIPDDENIFYEMTVKNKRYQATFYQRPKESSLDQDLIKEHLLSKLLNKYTIEELENPTDEIQKYMINSSLDYLMELSSKKTVWFMISEYNGKYFISLYYDNEYNHANGEDL